ncbi:MAG TPA: HYR domain-containing protein [Chromatiales bacterium]|nr:HYR domain-containing protein [Chromatiales bacterium]
MHANRIARIACAALVWLLPAFSFPTPAAAGRIAGAEYFFDVDPGPGNGTPLPAKDGAFDQVEEEVEVDLTGMTGPVGRHTLYVRFRNAAGVWGLARPVPGDNLFTAPYNFRLTGDKWIAAAEYFIDTDPGEGSATPLEAADGAFDEAEEEIDFAGVDPSALSSGVHHLFVRLQDSEGVWGPARRVAFQGRPLGGCEYYIDSDPGQGAGTALTASDGAFDTGAELVELSAVDTTGLDEGWHTLYVRCLDARGYWGDPEPHDFYADYTAPVVDITAPAGCTPDPTPLLTCMVTDARPTTQVVTVDGTVVDKQCGDSLDALADGTHTVTVTSTDAAGNEGTTSSSFVVGATGPTVAVTAPQGFTNDPTPLLAYTVDDATAGIVVTVDGEEVSKSSGDSLDPLADGPHEVVVTPTNDCGATGSDSAAFTVDTTLPALVVTAPEDGAVTNDATPLLSFTLDEANPGTTVVNVDGAAVSKQTGDSLDALADGVHTVSVTHTDLAGNQAAASSTFTVDTTPPVVALTAPPEGAVTNDATPLLSFTLDEANPGTTVVSVDGAAVSKETGDSLDPLADGFHTVSVTHTDQAANRASTASTFTVDTTPPAVGITSPAAGSFTADATPVLRFTVDDPAAAVLVAVDGTVVDKTSGDSLDALAEGSHTVTVKATDEAGNARTASASFTVELTSPVVSITAPAQGLVTNDPTPLLTFTVEATSPTATEVRVDGMPVGTGSGSPLDGLQDGTHTVVVEAIDPAGRRGSDSSEFTIDTVPPVVTIESPTCGWRYRDTSLLLAYTVSEGPPEVLLNGSPIQAASGSTIGPLDVMQHTVRVQANDDAGNSGAANCTFEITDTHCSDQDGDRRIGLSELLRVVQLFNGFAYHCDEATEDGYAPGSGNQSCQPHDADYQDPRWSINLSELLRIIQIYNSGGYHLDPSGEDGFGLGT